MGTGSAPAREFDRYLDAIMDLTRQPDSRELLTALSRTLSESIRAQRARLFALSNPDHDTDFNESNIQHAVLNDLFDQEFGEPRPLGAEADLVACICSRKSVVRETPEGRLLVFPVFGRRHVRALLVIEELGDATISNELLTKLLQV